MRLKPKIPLSTWEKLKTPSDKLASLILLSQKKADVISIRKALKYRDEHAR